MFRNNREEYECYGNLNGESNRSQSVLNGETYSELSTLTDAVENLKDACDGAKKEVRKINFAPLIMFLALIIIGGAVVLPNIIEVPTIYEIFNIPVVTKSDTGMVVDKFSKDITGSNKTNFYVTVEREIITDGEASIEVEEYWVPYKHYEQMEIGTVVTFDENGELYSYEIPDEDEITE